MTHDIVIVGTGQAGKPLALDLASAGRRTAVIERGPVGGTCVNVGCTPTKTLVAGARVAYLSRRAGDYGVTSAFSGVDLRRARARKEAVVTMFRDGGRRSLEEADNLDLILGEARFAGPKTIEVALADGGIRELTAETIIINSGGRPGIPKLDGLDGVPFLDSTSIMELEELPGRLLVLGGGYVGLEFAQMFRRFGSEVAVLQRNDRLLPREDADVSEAVAGILRDDGIEIVTGASASSVAGRSGSVALTVRCGGTVRTFEGSHLLVAAGRVPNTERLNLQAAGVRVDLRGFIEVDDRLETCVPGVFAAGDVKGGPQFTHISYDDYRILSGRILEGSDRSIVNRLVPYTVYIDPQLGRVGLTEREALQRGLKVRVTRMPMEYVARAIEMGETRGFMKVIVDEGSDRILGCAVLGVEGGELMSMVQIAMMGGVPWTVLRDGIFAHPTLAESLNNLFASLDEER